MTLEAPTVVDCVCGLRYMKTAVATLTPEIGYARCPCGRVLERWSGAFRLTFEPEEGVGPEVIPE